ncbi:MAG: hypothetical protein RLN70_06165, partial [Rhodospirillaceae bacterium]
MNAMFRSRPRLSRRVDHMLYPEQLLLKAIRLWVIGYRLNAAPEDRIALAFETAGIEDGRQAFEEFMIAVTAGAARSLCVHCVCHKTVG